MAAKPTRLTQKIAIQLYLVEENCATCSSCSRWPVRKLLNTPSYIHFSSSSSSSLCRSIHCLYRNYWHCTLHTKIHQAVGILVPVSSKLTLLQYTKLNSNLSAFQLGPIVVVIGVSGSWWQGQERSNSHSKRHNIDGIATRSRIWLIIIIITLCVLKYRKNKTHSM
jgi:hypothetical protein